MVENVSTSFIPITVIVKKESRLHLLLNINNAAALLEKRFLTLSFIINKNLSPDPPLLAA